MRCAVPKGVRWPRARSIKSSRRSQEYVMVRDDRTSESTLNRLAEGERHFNIIQAGLRAVASTWTLAAFAGIAVLLRQTTEFTWLLSPLPHIVRRGGPNWSRGRFTLDPAVLDPTCSTLRTARGSLPYDRMVISTRQYNITQPGSARLALRACIVRHSFEDG